MMPQINGQSLQELFLKAEKAISEIEDNRLIIKLLAIKGLVYSLQVLQGMKESALFV